MVTVISKYKCEICNKVYDSYNEANNCQMQGYKEEPKFNIGECYNFVTAYEYGSYDNEDYEGIELIRIIDIIKSHKVKYICEVYDEAEKEWYIKDYIIEGNDYFNNWQRGNYKNTIK